MKKMIFVIAALLLVSCGLLISLTPDILSLIILLVMCLVLVLGFFLGLMPAINYAAGFQTACRNIAQSLDVQSSETWIAVFKLDMLFRSRYLDNLFLEYKVKANEQRERGRIISDVEDYISEELLSLRTWQSFVLQIPGILTGLGILGTFIGLITGISSIGFSSVEAALESVSLLLSGIETAFFTSIAGVILSILFNMLNRIVWNSLLREYGMFTDTFHKYVILTSEEQEMIKRDRDMEKVLERLDRIPKDPGFSLSYLNNGAAMSAGNEQIMMSQIIKGLKNDQFVVYLQPRVELANRKIAALEALVRWNHPTLGLMVPGSFIPVLERNGFITKMDTYIWEQVCRTIRKWIDNGIRPVPVSLNVSQMDLMAMDVPAFFESMLNKYRIPPRALELELPRSAYISSAETAAAATGILRQMGFKVIMDGFDGDYLAVNMLENIEVDALKLDLRFTSDNLNIRDVFEQARKLGVEIMAAGIESAEQISVLRKAGCAIGQGFSFYKPMSVEAYEGLS